MIIDCILKAIMLFILYNIITISLFGIPESLPKTFHLYRNKNDGFRFMFYVFNLLMCIFLAPCWIKLSGTPFIKELSIFNIVLLFLVGFTPTIFKIKEESIINQSLIDFCKICVRTVSCCSSFLFILWIVLATPFWWVVLFVTLIIATVAFITKTLKNCYTYWIEFIGYTSTFITMLLMI